MRESVKLSGGTDYIVVMHLQNHSMTNWYREFDRGYVFAKGEPSSIDIHEI